MDFQETLIPLMEDHLETEKRVLQETQVTEFIYPTKEEREGGASFLRPRKISRPRTEDEISKKLDALAILYKHVIDEVSRHSLQELAPWSSGELIALSHYFMPDDNKICSTTYNVLKACYGRQENQTNPETPWYPDLFMRTIRNNILPLPEEITRCPDEDTESFVSKRMQEWKDFFDQNQQWIQSMLNTMDLNIHRIAEDQIDIAVKSACLGNTNPFAYPLLSGYLHTLWTALFAGRDGSFALGIIDNFISHLKNHYTPEYQWTLQNTPYRRTVCLHSDRINLEVDIEGHVESEGRGVLLVRAVNPNDAGQNVDSFFHFHTPPQQIMDWLLEHALFASPSESAEVTPAI